MINNKISVSYDVSLVLKEEKEKIKRLLKYHVMSLKEVDNMG